MSRESLNNLLEEDLNYYNSYLSDQKLNIDKKYLSTMITKTDMLKIGDQMTETFFTDDSDYEWDSDSYLFSCNVYSNKTSIRSKY